MTNIKTKIIKIIIIVLMIHMIFAIVNVSKANNQSENRIHWGNIFDSADNFLETGRNEAADGEIIVDVTEGEDGSQRNVILSLPKDDALKPVIEDIYNILFPLGVAITVIVGGALGIKFMLASAEDKAKVKESLVPYVAGCIVIYGAFGIWKIAIMLFSAIN